LSAIQAELRAEKSDFNIELLGINQTGQGPYNDLMYSLGNIPWLQDAFPELVWSRWGVTYRDVWILDPENRMVSVYNLTANDLGLATKRNALKQLFRDAARAVDVDNDKLPDLWEQHYFGNIDATPLGDGDGDGVDNYTEFAFGTNPAFAPSRPWLIPRITAGRQLVVTFRRFSGAVDFAVDLSADLTQWAPSGSSSASWPSRNLFDGSGNVETTFSLSGALPSQGTGFLRMRAVR